MRKDMETDISSTDKKDVFEERLRAALTEKTDEAVNKLLQFRKEQPDSKFAEDAGLVGNFILFRNESEGEMTPAEMMKKQEPIAECMKAITNAIIQHPDGQLKESTYRKIIEIVGNDEAVKHYNALRIPYRYIMYYLSGVASAKFKDWQSTITNLVIVKNAIGYSRDCKAVLEFDIYPALATAYKETGKFQDAYDTAKEGSEKFANDEWFRKFMEEVKPKVPK